MKCSVCDGHGGWRSSVTGLNISCPHCRKTGKEPDKPIAISVRLLAERLDEVEYALSIALPYIETAKDDPTYRRERVTAVLKRTTDVLLGR